MYGVYKSLSDKLEEDEVVFAIKVEYVQTIAENMGRKPLNYDEMDSVRKGIEWGLDFWGDIVITAINNLPTEYEDVEDNEEVNSEY